MTTPNEYLTEGAIVGCQHTLDRRNQWNANGACPICLYASREMYRQDINEMSEHFSRFRSMLKAHANHLPSEIMLIANDKVVGKKLAEWLHRLGEIIEYGEASEKCHGKM